MSKTTYTGIESKILIDGFNFFLKYKDMRNSDKEWENCIDDANNIVKKYKNHPFAENIILSISEQIERLAENKKVLSHTNNEWEMFAKTIKTGF